MKKPLLPKPLNFILPIYLLWFIFLLLSIFIGQHLFKLQSNFLMGGRAAHLTSPYVWSWGNFDGEHYIAIAREGYKPLTYFYFPVYPLLIRTITRCFGSSLYNYYLSSLFISHLSFLGSLILLIKLTKSEKKDSSIKQTIFLLLVYPFSFFLIASYTESLFLFILLISFYSARKGNFLLASFAAGLLSAVRLVGVAMLPALFVEWYLQNKRNKKIRQLIFLPLSLLGLLIYMYYLRSTTGDALNFLNTVEIFGSQRSATLILLPQVFYRYFFKIIPNLSSYFPSLFVTFWELLVAILGLVILIAGYFKLRASYWVYTLGAYLIPTLSGSFSSLPRYILVAFPLFIVGASWLDSTKLYLKIAIYLALIINLLIAFGLFSNGYFVS